ncbi:hypothetical protein NMYAN_110090 [Nitrosomonas nitrosa]|uniref:Uncharacterized protein n=1 Tax=Nitrosomonas nitrosa TaxID=52442 RepID=A0A8H8YXK3_9PROT|nr:hypothetical protein NMYAN_110090 [Nitrosomonas nitrosa]
MVGLKANVGTAYLTGYKYAALSTVLQHRDLECTYDLEFTHAHFK